MTDAEIDGADERTWLPRLRRWAQRRPSSGADRLREVVAA